MAKLPKTHTIITDKNGRTRIVPDYEKQRRQKPAGQQYWKTDTVKVKR